MFAELAVNFCILFTFSVLSYWPFQDRSRFSIPFPRLHPLMIGGLAGAAGIFLVEMSISVTPDLVLDARLAVVVISGVFGGPAAPLISGLMTGLYRLASTGLSVVSVISGMNVMLIGTAAAILFLRFGSTFRSAAAIYSLAVVEQVLVIALLLPDGAPLAGTVLLFVAYSAVCFLVVSFTLQELSLHFLKLADYERKSKTDDLTGLNNLRTYRELSGDILQESDGPVALLLADIDRFKQVNDLYGHQAGDRVLQQLAIRLNDAARPFGGIVFRNGGEEFSVLLPRAGKQEAAILAEKIRAEVAGAPFAAGPGMPLPVTVSLGTAVFPDDASGPEALYRRADEALYAAKEDGRNRTVAWTPRPVSEIKT